MLNLEMTVEQIDVKNEKVCVMGQPKLSSQHLRHPHGIYRSSAGT